MALATNRADKALLSQNETGTMRVIETTTSKAAGSAPRSPEHALLPQAEGSRALVALAPAAAAHQAMASYRQAAFLAHLIAMKDQLPQTRERRRAEPGEALAAYRAVAAMTR
jgi:hypothetical protein